MSDDAAAMLALRDRKTAYEVTLGAADLPHVAAVLADLRWFCRADESEYHINDRMHALLSGRREVWLRIEQHLKLDLESLYRKLNGEQT